MMILVFGEVSVNQQVLDAPNSPSVSQRGISYCGVNTVERPKKDNKSLLYYNIKPPEKLPLVFLDAQESEFSDNTFVDDLSIVYSILKSIDYWS
jgi:hypothetical protein